MATNRLETILLSARQLSPEELAQLIKQAADLLAQIRQPASSLTPRYVSLFGSGKGAYATPEAADGFVRGEREAWER